MARRGSASAEMPAAAPEDGVEYPVRLGKSFFVDPSDPSTSKAFHALQYSWKPSSINEAEPGAIQYTYDKSFTVEFKNKQTPSKVVSLQGQFKRCKETDCIAIFDGTSFVLERLSGVGVNLKSSRGPAKAPLVPTEPSAYAALVASASAATSVGRGKKRGLEATPKPKAARKGKASATPAATPAPTPTPKRRKVEVQPPAPVPVPEPTEVPLDSASQEAAIDEEFASLFSDDEAKDSDVESLSESEVEMGEEEEEDSTPMTTQTTNIQPVHTQPVAQKQPAQSHTQTNQAQSTPAQQTTQTSAAPISILPKFLSGDVTRSPLSGARSPLSETSDSESPSNSSDSDSESDSESEPSSSPSPSESESDSSD